MIGYFLERMKIRQLLSTAPNGFLPSAVVNSLGENLNIDPRGRRESVRSVSVMDCVVSR